jgi:hypothetical protein
MPATRLLLHAGQIKTGSTFLQSILHKNRDRLARLGIDYPARGRSPKSDATITSGNGFGLLRQPDQMRAMLAAHPPAPGGATLYSGESMLFGKANWAGPDAEAPNVSFLPSLAREAGYDRIEILLLVRDPVEHAASVAGQLIKRHASTQTLESLFAGFNQPILAARFLRQADTLEGVRITVMNYSRCRKSLLEAFTGWAGVAPESLEPISVKQSNRSLTSAELALQREVNAVLSDQWSSRILADALCERLPDISGSMPLPAAVVQEAMCDRLAPFMAEVDAWLPDGAGYRRDIRTPDTANDQHMFSDAQLAVIAGSLGGEILRLRTEIERMRRDPSRGIPMRRLAMGMAVKTARFVGLTAR